MNFIKYVFWLAFLLSSLAHANDAAKCIELGDDLKQNSRSLTNTCSREVIVFWCHSNVDANSKSSACDPTKKLYKQNFLLKPNDVKTNRFSLPLGSTIHYGACFGRYYSFELIDGEGTYLCKPEQVKSEARKSRLVHTVGRSLEEEACKAALLSALPFGNPSGCTCEKSGQMNICRVESDDKSRSSDALLNSVKAKLREYASCMAEDRRDCVLPRSVAIGIRN